MIKVVIEGTSHKVEFFETICGIEVEDLDETFYQSPSFPTCKTCAAEMRVRYGTDTWRDRAYRWPSVK